MEKVLGTGQLRMLHHFDPDNVCFIKFSGDRDKGFATVSEYSPPLSGDHFLKSVMVLFISSVPARG